MSELNVLLLALSRSFGGAEVRVLTQARALHARNIPCSVAVLPNSQLHQQLQAEALPHITLKSGRGSLAMLTELRNHIQRGGFNVIDAHNVQSIWWGMWAGTWAGVPRRVATIHSDFAAEYPGIKGKLYAGVLTLTRGVTHHLINVTEVLQSQATIRGLAHKSTLIPNAVPVPAQPLQGRRHDIAADWGYSPQDVIVGIVGRLVPVKGHAYLIEAFAQLQDLPQLKLVIVGNGALEDALKAQVNALGLGAQVHFTGFRQDIPDVMQNLDVLCMASLSEALPYVILEAASFARPLLVTEVGGLKTLLQTEQTALLVPPQNASALADALRRLATDAPFRERLGLAAYTLVRERFSVERMMQQILAVYHAE